MKTLISTLGLAVLLAASPAIAHEDHGKSMHGGFVLDAGHAQFEIVGKGETVTVHVSDHGKPVATAGAAGKLTILTGSSKREIELKPAAADQLQGQGVINPGDRVLLNVGWPGQKPMSARTTVKKENAHAGHH
ncbi:hypothetical protein [uncultured Azonexus sp.]|uniref:hypothetical protein n=1 Tax=uncultured Azonexus sp. TaxID=520307 RepID=UPI002606FA73|nr:hypothetical protein [uncultured Azonexus sp.]